MIAENGLSSAAMHETGPTRENGYIGRDTEMGIFVTLKTENEIDAAVLDVLTDGEGSPSPSQQTLAARITDAVVATLETKGEEA